MVPVLITRYTLTRTHTHTLPSLSNRNVRPRNRAKKIKQSKGILHRPAMTQHPSNGDDGASPYHPLHKYTHSRACQKLIERPRNNAKNVELESVDGNNPAPPPKTGWQSYLTMRPPGPPNINVEVSAGGAGFFPFTPEGARPRRPANIKPGCKRATKPILKIGAGFFPPTVMISWVFPPPFDGYHDHDGHAAHENHDDHGHYMIVMTIIALDHLSSTISNYHQPSCLIHHHHPCAIIINMSMMYIDLTYMSPPLQFST